MPFFAEGARGLLITPLRTRFTLAVHEDPVFDEFDAALTAKVREFQDAKGAAPTGRVDKALYKELTTLDWPGLLDRAAMVVASIENHGYFSKTTPDITDVDEAGITAGVIGFTAKSGSLLRVLHDAGTQVLTDAFDAFNIPQAERDKFDKLMALRSAKNKEAERRQQAIDLFLSKPQKKVLKRWRDVLERVLKSDEGMAAQRKRLEEEYFKPATTAAQHNGITSEYGHVLAFSICVQSGSLATFPLTGDERTRRLTIASLRTEQIRRSVVRNFETRHFGLAAGRGFPNQRYVDLTRWGFDDPDTAPPPRQRILSLAVSDAPAMAALPQFEIAAVAANVVEERVLETAAMRERIKNAGFTSLDFSQIWRDNLLAPENRKPRARRAELLAELNELPVSCLVLGAPSVGKRTLKTRGRPVTLNAINSALTWQNGDNLWFPLCPVIRSGLVIVYAPSGVAKGDSFAHSIQGAISKINEQPPLVLGWEGPSPFPGAAIAACAQTFFTELQAAMAPAGAPKTLDVLVFLFAEKIIQAWGKACHNAFAADKTFKGLWRRDTRLMTDPLSACAALAPDGTRWRAMAQPAGGVFMEKVV